MKSHQDKNFVADFQSLVDVGIYDVSNNLYSSSSNFFNVGNYIFTFVSDFHPDDQLKLHIHYYENMIEFCLRSSIESLRSLTLNNNVQNFFNCDLFNPVVVNFSESTIFTDIQVITTELAVNMKQVTKPKNDIDLLREIFPQFADDMIMFEVLSYDDDGTLYDDLSTPDVKLYYPEPFVASPSFVHEDVWFLHILQYQHWLWFFFISLIMFFFITFINTVRWCNARTKPKRETRGVSRSKCADLITACVPVSWAMSIIISESVDAADYYDGFGTGEIVIGIRAYQWGWEYFYPKGIDLNYTVSPSYSTAVGNSLKYSNTAEQTIQSNTLWKHYQLNNNSNGTSTPAHVILSPTDNSKILNFTNFDDIGVNTLQGSKAFKKIQRFSKTNNQDLFLNISDFNSRYTRLSDLYFTNKNLIDSTTYNTIRQSSFISNLSTQNQPTNFLDTTSVNKFLNYNWDLTDTKKNNSTSPITILNSYQETALTSPNYLTDNKTYSNPVQFTLGSNPSNVINDSTSEFSFNNERNSFVNNLSQDKIEYSFQDLKSVNTSITASDRTVRNTDSLSNSKLSTNTRESGNSITDNILQENKKTLGNNISNINNSASKNWASFMHNYRLLNSQTTAPTHTTPTVGTSPYFKSLSFDKSINSNQDALLLKSKEEAAPSIIFETYWLTHWANSQNEFYFNHLNQLFNNTKYSSFPLISEYMEYDFKNWQTLESLEDVFWESSYASFNQDEYLNTKNNLNSSTYFNSQDELHNLTFRQKKFKFNKSTSEGNLDFDRADKFNTLPILSVDSIPNTSLIKLQDYRLFINEPLSDSFEDSYENLKQLNLLYGKNYNYLTSLDSNQVNPLPYTQVLDSFRADVDDTTWNTNTVASYSVNNLNNLDTVNTFDNRISNPLKLRSTAKNSMVTYSAMQKVFKSRLDEGRSNARLQDVSNSYNPYLFLNAPRSNYEGLLSKNTDNFFKVSMYNTFLKSTFSSMYEVNTLLNSYFTDLPFLVSQISDSSRHLWFDWQSRWTSFEVQPSSTARYSLLGVPYTNRSFEYTTQQGDEINDSENYLVRLSRARKNYSTSWAYTPYLYSRLTAWQQNSELNMLNYNLTNLVDFKLNLCNLKDLYLNNNNNNTTLQTTPSYPSFNTPGRDFIQPNKGVSAYNYNMTTLTTLLTKREFLYRQYLKSKGSTLYLPNYLTSTPSNPLFLELKNNFPMLDPSTFSSEISREYLYNNTNFFQLNILQNVISNNTSLLNYPLFYLFGLNKPTNIGSNTELFKNQYRPMRKGITNMIRLHATGAVALPTEIRLHILASSKDVIHSWSIPSAGIKIDCVPGFSSHRVAIFLNSGIYWGQCMEICGRFHHWMPIILYFMKRDLFFLWCTHFQQYSTDTSVRSATSNINSLSYKPTYYNNWSTLNI